MAKSKEASSVKKPSRNAAKKPATKSSSKTDLNKLLASDSDNGEGTVKAVGTPKPKGTTALAKQINGSAAKSAPESISSPSEEDSSEEDSSSSEASDDDGSEGSDESGSSEDEESDAAQQPIPTRQISTPSKVNGVKRKADEQNSSEEESSDQDDSDEKASGPQAKKAKTAEESSEEESDDSEENDSLPAANPISTTAPQTQPAAAAAAAAAAPLSPMTPIAPRQFKPPKGFVPVTKLSPSPLFNPTALSDKQQIWHITAPSNLPLASLLKDLTPAHLQNGTVVLKHKKTPYSFRSVDPEDPQPSEALSLLLPSSHIHDVDPDAEDTYTLAPVAITKTLHLQPHFEKPSLGLKQAGSLTGSDAGTSVFAALGSYVRPQPKGMRMRYRPPGSGRGDLWAVGSGSEEGESEEDKAGDDGGFRFPRALGAHGAATVEKNVKKGEKGKRKEREKEKGKKGRSMGEEDEGKENHEEEEAREERRLRKEMKKAKREAKAKAREAVEVATK